MLSVTLNLIFRFNAIPIRIPEDYFVDINKLTLQFIWRGKKSRTVNTILKEENKIGAIMLPNFKTYYNATVIKTVWYL